MVRAGRQLVWRQREVGGVGCGVHGVLGTSQWRYLMEVYKPSSMAGHLNLGSFPLRVQMAVAAPTS